MEWREPVEVAKISKREQRQLDVLNRWRSIRNESESYAFGFSHGNLILRSAWSTILGNFLFYGITLSSCFVIIGLLKKARSYPSIHLFYFHIPQFAVQLVLYFAGVAALDVASTLFGFSWRKRSIWIGVYMVLVFIAPMFLFHWSFMGY